MALTAKINLLKSLETHKKFKNQPRPLVRPSSEYLCWNFWNLSHETVHLKNNVLSGISGTLHLVRIKSNKYNEMHCHHLHNIAAFFYFSNLTKTCPIAFLQSKITPICLWYEFMYSDKSTLHLSHKINNKCSETQLPSLLAVFYLIIASQVHNKNFLLLSFKIKLRLLKGYIFYKILCLLSWLHISL
jgi:hypothetical protein